MSTEATVAVQCSNPDCKIAESGKCVENLEPASCGNFGKPLAVIEGPVGLSRLDARHVALPRADRLTIAEARVSLQRTRTRVVAIVGPHDAGKTSLIASLYDQFQLGTLAAFAFQRSTTLHAFEQACHDARAASERGIPHSERTKRGEVRFYQLSLTQQGTNERIDLVLGDRAGEEYREAGDDLAAASDFIEISRADVVAVLVDGDRLSRNSQRHNVRSELLLIVQALAESGLLSSKFRLAVVLTKLDAVRTLGSAERVEADLASDAARLAAIFAAQLAEVQVFRVAASPKEEGAARGEGIADLLTFWLAESEPKIDEGVAPEPHPRLYARITEVSGGAS